MNVLSGVRGPTQGELLLDGKEVRFRQPYEAIKQGVSMVHQELHLVEDLSVAENIFLGREPMGDRLGISIDRATMHQGAAHFLSLLGSDLDPTRSARELSIADAQFVEIAKCLKEVNRRTEHPR